jgi:hypothetical protein
MFAGVTVALTLVMWLIEFKLYGEFIGLISLLIEVPPNLLRAC